MPQLHEAAAWLATMLPDLFRRLMETDAQFLLRSDAATTDAKDRRDLAENLLLLFDEERLLDFDYDLRRRCSKLKHPRLAEQLQRYIRNREKGVVVRRAAVMIAEACEVPSLLDDLVAVSLDPADAYEVRKAAAFAILRMGDHNAKGALRPLALGEAGPDPEDDLKGSGLACAWPGFLTAYELFRALTPPQRSNYFGMYRQFIRRRLSNTSAKRISLSHSTG